MRTIKVLAIVGLVVALVGVQGLSQGGRLFASGTATASLTAVDVEVQAGIERPVVGPCRQATRDALAAGAAQRLLLATAECKLGIKPPPPAPPGQQYAFAKQTATADPAANRVKIEGESEIIASRGEILVTATAVFDKEVRAGDKITVTIDRFKLDRGEVKIAILKGKDPISPAQTITRAGTYEFTLTGGARKDELVLQLTMNLLVVPTLTQWGLIALAMFLAGGMGYMIYRRRPALRPATP